MHLQALVRKWFGGAYCLAASLNEIKGSFCQFSTAHITDPLYLSSSPAV